MIIYVCVQLVNLKEYITLTGNFLPFLLLFLDVYWFNSKYISRERERSSYNLTGSCNSFYRFPHFSHAELYNNQIRVYRLNKETKKEGVGS